MEKIYLRVGKNIAKYRKIARLSQARLAIVSGIGLRYIQRLEGKPSKRVMIHTLEKIADALKISVDKLLK